MRKIISKVLLLVLVVYVALQIIPYGKNKIDNPFTKQDRPLVIAHGGAKAMNPENTWMAFEYAYELGVDSLEIDLCMTKDGILVTHHNTTIDATSDHSGKVNDYTYEELKQMNFGADFTALDGTQPYAHLTQEQLQTEYKNQLYPVDIEELFQRYGNTILYILEVKDEDELGIQAAEQLLNLIEKYDLEEYVCVASFHEDIMEHINDVKSDRIVTSLDMGKATDFVIANYSGYGYFTNFDGAGFQLPMEEYNIPLATKYLIYKIHKNDMFVHYWTINTKEEMRTCINNGADGIITDRPDLLYEVLEELGY
ncbi:MAG: glycerophosphodiester phosphodiesterase [Erysipelotrichales bacterium]|nr:glycerophosphodiester phosphodiesterase [Erysipelotrichales bacterium]